VSSLNRLLAILQLFTSERSEWTVRAAASEINVSIPTAYRYFRSLCKAGFLDPIVDGHYVLGPAIIEYDRRIRMGDPLINIGQSVLQRLIVQTSSTGIAMICRFYRNQVMCVHQEGTYLSGNPVSYERGRPMPLFIGAPGKIIFAHLSSRLARSYFTKYPDEIAAGGFGTDWDIVKFNLRRMRKAGVCIARGEVDKDRVGIAAAIIGSNNNVVGAITMALPKHEATPQFIANVSTLVQAAGREISTGLALLSEVDVPNKNLQASHEISI